ncbi:hypothetical protein [Pseudomonas viridiflava]
MKRKATQSSVATTGGALCRFDRPSYQQIAKLLGYIIRFVYGSRQSDGLFLRRLKNRFDFLAFYPQKGALRSHYLDNRHSACESKSEVSAMRCKNCNTLILGQMSKIFWSGTFFGAGAVLTWLIYSNII